MSLFYFVLIIQIIQSLTEMYFLLLLKDGRTSFFLEANNQMQLIFECM